MSLKILVPEAVKRATMTTAARCTARRTMHVDVKKATEAAELALEALHSIGDNTMVSDEELAERARRRLAEALEALR